MSKQELEILYHDMWKCLLSKDIDKLDEMHSDDFVLVHMTGLNQPKTDSSHG